ncbi:hypothetical protein J437_LFUL004957 [Ladona fulva]|uniref:Uncharacterized protein n=1 Tax=Ladona fulva TaxID=123851 RepID=A0A8K0NXK6_LADFU|nr:hypothetical protein J437_LFUL004957 [Ladona fulva]
MGPLFFRDFICSSGASNHEWDILIFTQSWPITVCRQWKVRDEDHTCSFPPMKGKWTVHGIWPTKYGTHGPGYCNSTWRFDEEKIIPIEKQLNQYWPNIQNGTSRYALWEHEWEKHGTCATAIDQLNSEEKYFHQGIVWAEKYDLSNILSENNIHPGPKGLTAQSIAESVKKSLNRNPYLECYKDHASLTTIETNEEYILEIRICFDKSLELVDCDGINVLGTKGSLTNCPGGEPIFYLNKVPPKESGYMTALMFVTFLQWLTR